MSCKASVASTPNPSKFDATGAKPPNLSCKPVGARALPSWRSGHDARAEMDERKAPNTSKLCQKHRNDCHKKSFPRSTLWPLGVQEQCTIPASGDKDRTQLVGQSPERSLKDVGKILTSKDLNRPPLTSRHLAASACSATAFPTSKANLSMKLSTPQLNHHASSGVQIIRFFVCVFQLWLNGF